MRSNYGAEALLLSRCNDKNLIIITDKEFEEAIKITVFNLEIFKYCTPIDFNKN